MEPLPSQAKAIPLTPFHSPGYPQEERKGFTKSDTSLILLRDGAKLEALPYSDREGLDAEFESACHAFNACRGAEAFPKFGEWYRSDASLSGSASK
jgi:hypothetical protein